MTRTVLHRFFSPGLLLLGLLAAGQVALAERPAPAFAPGERLTYEIRWMFIPAGEAVLQVEPQTHIQGQPARHFVMTVRTNTFVDAFYKVRDRIEAWTDIDLNRSLHYRKQQRQGSHRWRDVAVAFDWDARQAAYSDRGRTLAPVTLIDGALDPLSAFYFTRLQALIPGTVIERPVTDGKKTVMGRARVVGREQIQVPAGIFDTVRIEPDLRDVKGVFEKSPEGRIHLWLTDDARHIPVRIRSQVAVGHFSGELVATEGILPLPCRTAGR